MDMELPVIQGKTFTPIYSQTEDRIRLVVNYADYNQRCDLWLTRAFLLKLIPAIEDTLDQHDTVPQAPQIQLQTDQSAQSKTDAPTLSFTEKEGYLVHTVDITHHKKENNFTLVFKTPTLQVQTTMGAPYLRTLLKAIFASIPKIDWGISPQWIR